MPLIPVPGPTQIATFAQRIRKERKRKATEPQVVLSYEQKPPWLSGSQSNVRVSLRATNVGKRAASKVAIHVPWLIWLPGGTNAELKDSGAWSLALQDSAERMHRTPQELAPCESRFAWVAQIDKYSLRFIGGPTSVETFEEAGTLRVRAVLSWVDPAESAASHVDEYEIEIDWLKRPPVPGSGFTVKLGIFLP
jgi:hypothetical protein